MAKYIIKSTHYVLSRKEPGKTIEMVFYFNNYLFNGMVPTWGSREEAHVYDFRTEAARMASRLRLRKLKSDKIVIEKIA